MKDVWLKAAVIGSLWAAIEIVIGSFLHNLRVPFAGSVLASSSVILVIAFLRIWPMKGLAIRAAAIAALMKSISPSAVIIGPMTGIFLEGLLIEAALLLFGVNRLAFFVGGMLAVWSAFLHKLVTLFLIYGSDFVEIIQNLYQYAVRQIGIAGNSLWEPIAVLSVVYLAFGSLAAGIGLRLRPDPISRLNLNQDLTGKNLFELTEKNTYSVFYLVLILIGLISVLSVMNLYGALVYLPVSLLFLGFLAVRYSRAIRPLTRPKFWIQLVLITFLAALLIDGFETGHWISWRGVKAGLLINLRAMTVLMAFAALGTELKNPLIKSLLYRRGFAPLYSSLQMAFSVLPSLMAHLPAQIRSIKDIPHLASGFLGLSRDLYTVYAKMDSGRPTVFLICGARQTGKTTFLRTLTGELKRDGVRLGGFIAQVVKQEEQVKGYELEMLDQEQKVLFCSLDENDTPTNDRIGRFFIHPDGLMAGREAFRRARQEPMEVFVIDEVGPLEMKNRGWSQGIAALCSQASLIQVWSVRDSLSEKVTRKWPGYQYIQVSVGTDDPLDIARQMKHLLQQS